MKENIYKSLIIFLLRKLKWDISKKARISKRKLSQLKDIQKGQKAVILCNGPSLNLVDFDALKASGVYVFGLNKINLLFSRVDFRPDSIVCVNQKVLEQNAQFYSETDIDLFLPYHSSYNHCANIPVRDNISYLFPYEMRGYPVSDVTDHVLIGATVTNVALQIALHMGFEEIALVGCDHNFAVKGVPHQSVKSDEKDSCHFDENYFAGGVSWDLPDLTQSELTYERIGYLANSLDRKIYNCTEGGNLEVFERLSFETFIANGKI